MEKISIFNYEAYYLDFLEGNLNEVDSVLLTAFLQANPDLILEDDSLPQFSSSAIELDGLTKKSLKRSVVEDKITAENVEFFLISELEDLLGENKKKELNEFITGNKVLEREKAMYSSVYFSPVESIVYTEKSALKHKRVVVLWPYVTAMAAASVIAFFMIWYSTSNKGISNQNNTPVFADKKTNKKFPKAIKQENVIEGADNQKVNKSIVNYNEPLINKNQNENVVLANETNNMPVDEMERKPIFPVLTSLNDRNIEPITNKLIVEPELREAEKDYAAAYFGEMQNPIEPITNFIGDKTKRDIDFRTAKKTDKNPGGFFLKIGKFEVSRKKH